MLEEARALYDRMDQGTESAAFPAQLGDDPLDLARSAYCGAVPVA